MKKSNKKGFTLVELVVVIAIIGILAAILVPTMMNYVKKAKLKSANSNAKLVFTTVNNQLADLIVEDQAITTGVRSEVLISALNASDPLEKAVSDALKDNGDNAGRVSWMVNGTTNEVEWAQWMGGTTGAKSFVGQYPDPCTDADATTVQLTALPGTKITF